MSREFLNTIFIHLNCSSVLFLFNINMCYINPNIWEISRCLTNLCKYISSFINKSFMC
ncbi:unnamed protein product [Schistosoma mattheei]|uniref:Uncharacterized protein n=2 Tax=Schistosoma TaxID=6181 RepID=A0A3P8E3H6_9TREM|nr:unnamed protein product [Schistosoma mattheei]